jgi:hypothetical protein
MQCKNIGIVDNHQVNPNKKKVNPINANPKIKPKNRDEVPRPNQLLPNTNQDRKPFQNPLLKVLSEK